MLDVFEVGLEFLLDEFNIVVSCPSDHVVCKHAEFGLVFFYVVEEDVEECGSEDTPLRDSCLNGLGFRKFSFTFNWKRKRLSSNL